MCLYVDQEKVLNNFLAVDIEGKNMVVKLCFKIPANQCWQFVLRKKFSQLSEFALFFILDKVNYEESMHFLRPSDRPIN